MMHKLENYVLIAAGALALMGAIATVASAQAVPETKVTAAPRPDATNTNKYYTEPVIPAPIPPLPGKGLFNVIDGAAEPAPPSVIDSLHIHDGVFSDGLDLSSLPSLDDPLGFVTGQTGTAHASSAAYAGVLNQAITDAKTELRRALAGEPR